MLDSIVYVVHFTGPFGFIKPWTAVRDSEMYSQTFLTPSIVEGIRQKLEVSAVLRHRLRHRGMDLQQEQTQPADWERTRTEAKRLRAIVKRGVLLEPVLTLAFATEDEAAMAAQQHICLCRNEDVLLPVGGTEAITIEDFEKLPGIELLFGEADDAFLVGFNRFSEASPMYGRLLIVEDSL